MLRKLLLTTLILSLLTTYSRASDVVDYKSIKLFPGDKVPWYGILVTEQRYRDFRIYEKESHTMNDLLLEQTFEMRRMQEELNAKDLGTVRFKWFVIGVSVPLLVCLLLEDRCAFGSK